MHVEKSSQGYQTTSGPMIRAVSIMLQNLPIMLFGISLIFCLLCQIYVTPQVIMLL